MPSDALSRRDWLGLAPAALASLWPQIAAAQHHAHRAATSGAPPALTVLDPAMAAEIESLAAQIIPSDGAPGAREAGVIYFIDRALATFEKDKVERYRKGLAEVHARRAELFPGSRTIAALTAEQQIALLQAIEKSEFFGLLRFHTILGFFGDPSRGGNRDQVGWKLIGFEDRPAFEPPFGYYDDPAHRGDGE
jgi:gluconate 2-dehydrogenase gamma chain